MKLFSRQNNRVNKKKAFTLVELLVALGLFIVVVMISLGSVINILDAGRKAQSLESVMTNLDFAVEAMSRGIKFGTHYFCGTDPVNPHVLSQDCTGAVVPPGSSITFTTSDGIDTIYRLNSSTNQIEESVDHGVTYIGITAPEIVVQDLKFYVFGTTPYSGNDTHQPKVLMLVRGYAGTKPTTQSKFILQTLVSQRILDSQ